jgi:hypothetical protein
MRVRFVFGLLVGVASMMAAVACGSDDSGDDSSATRPGSTTPVCTPNQSIGCVGPGACSGFQVCAEDGSKLSTCDCSGSPPTGNAGTGGTSNQGGSGTGGSSNQGGSGSGGSDTIGNGGSSSGTAGTNSGAAGSTTGTGCDVGTPSSDNCVSCGECAKLTTCKKEWETANASEDFQQFSGCIFTCFDSACGEACDTEYPEGSALFGAFITCQVCTACPVTCVATELDTCK